MQRGAVAMDCPSIMIGGKMDKIRYDDLDNLEPRRPGNTHYVDIKTIIKVIEIRSGFKVGYIGIIINIL